jgi:hypothetical protein
LIGIAVFVFCFVRSRKRDEFQSARDAPMAAVAPAARVAIVTTEATDSSHDYDEAESESLKPFMPEWVATSETLDDDDEWHVKPSELCIGKELGLAVVACVLVIVDV